MTRTASLVVRASVLLAVFAGVIVFASVGSADPPPPDPDCDNTKLANLPWPPGLCGTATPCPSVDKQADCLGETAKICVVRWEKVAACEKGGTSSQKCVNRYDTICTETRLCDWTTTSGGVSYCDSCDEYLDGNGNLVFSIQPSGFYVTCIDKTK